MDRNDKQNRNHLGGETKTMDKTEQIKRRNLIIRDIESKEFELNMHRWACSTNSGMPLTLSDIKDRSLCNTALCIAGDASRRLIIGVGLRKALVMAQKHLGNLAQDEFFLLGATYLGLNAEEAEKLFFHYKWPAKQFKLYRDGSVAERKATAIEMLKRIIPD